MEEWIGASFLSGVFGPDAWPAALGGSSDRPTSHPLQEQGSAYSWVEDYLYRIEGKEARNAYYGWAGMGGPDPGKAGILSSTAPLWVCGGHAVTDAI